MKLRVGITAIFITTVIGTNITLAQEGPGHALYLKWCTPCHGAGEVASVFLEKMYKGSVQAVLEQREDLSRDLVLVRIRTPIRGMPAFRPTEISDIEADQIADYLSHDIDE